MPAKEVVFIDDLIENVVAAKEKGIHAILFESEEQIRKELGKLYHNRSPDCGIAAENIDLHPQECIAIEDSLFGLSAAVRANIGKVIALGPKDTHPTLLRLPGITSAISALSEVEREDLHAAPFSS